METYETIPAYIKTFPLVTRKKLRVIQQLAKQVAPSAHEAIKYGMPTFMALQDKKSENLFHFAAFKNHIGFYPTPQVINHFEKELLPYKTSKGAIQFPLEKDLPLDLIKDMMVWRVKSCVLYKKYK